MESDREESLHQLAQEVAGLRDLFTRRLMQDKQKNEMIRTLEDGARFAFIEPFLYDLILLLDRIEGEEDEMVISVREELEEILERRGLRRIETGENFDPKRCRIVKAIDSENTDVVRVTEVQRAGYEFAGRVLRPAEVVVEKPLRRQAQAEEQAEEISLPEENRKKDPRT